MEMPEKQTDNPLAFNRRQFLKNGVALGVLGVLAGCTPTQVRRSFTSAEQLYNGDVPSALTSQIPVTGIPQIDSLVRKQINKMVKELAKTWGDKKIASQKEYVKYTDKYKSRAIINFTTGHIRVETVVDKDEKTALKAAIISTLLTPDDPSTVDLLSDKSVKTGKKPFLYGLVVDQDQQSVTTQWRANRYADYLMAHAYQSDTYNGKPRHYVTFEMVKDHDANQQKKYSTQVSRQSKRFDIEPALVYAIIETESAFNPYAMSHIPAYGLMQIVPQTAGRDAYRLIHNKDVAPSKNYLFKPDNNIEMGTAYLHILDTKYLGSVKQEKSREYCVIAAYNTGSGNVLAAFDNDRGRAVEKINQLSSQQVYQHLVKNLKYEEARHYIQKVTRNKAKYLRA
ncbi:lytic transglycosylase [Hydrogenovibrio marinus]|uniref:Lytic transglycosylase n=2 Tax=Hydrogenovibrio marinus TaxID=28885 RepID=A0A067A077_HYDMR|nr:lytic transglycosylase [Hydrogenovibrio marinus]BBN58488.1 membrane-bound lytic murein transglycosylase C [Hydrogenovibrio marinus]